MVTAFNSNLPLWLYLGTTLLHFLQLLYNKYLYLENHFHISFFHQRVEKKVSMLTELNLQNQNSQTYKTSANRRHLLKAQAHKELNIGLLFPWVCHCSPPAEGGDTASFVYRMTAQPQVTGGRL